MIRVMIHAIWINFTLSRLQLTELMSCLAERLKHFPKFWAKPKSWVPDDSYKWNSESYWYHHGPGRFHTSQVSCRMSYKYGNCRNYLPLRRNLIGKHVWDMEGILTHFDICYRNVWLFDFLMDTFWPRGSTWHIYRQGSEEYFCGFWISKICIFGGTGQSCCILGFHIFGKYFLGFLSVPKYFLGLLRNTQLRWSLSVGMPRPPPGLFRFFIETL